MFHVMLGTQQNSNTQYIYVEFSHSGIGLTTAIPQSRCQNANGQTSGTAASLVLGE